MSKFSRPITYLDTIQLYNSVMQLFTLSNCHAPNLDQCYRIMKKREKNCIVLHTVLTLQVSMARWIRTLLGITAVDNQLSSIEVPT